MTSGCSRIITLPPPTVLLRFARITFRHRTPLLGSKRHSSTNSLQRSLAEKAALDKQERLYTQLDQIESAAIPSQRRVAEAKVRIAQAATMDAYNFPDYRLKKTMDDPSKTPLLLVACGSFSPITFLHLRMFVMAGDFVKFSTEFEIVGGYLSPVSDAYKKAGLATAEHRYESLVANRSR